MPFNRIISIFAIILIIQIRSTAAPVPKPAAKHEQRPVCG